jgi:hypothetical protein
MMLKARRKGEIIRCAVIRCRGQLGVRVRGPDGTVRGFHPWRTFTRLEDGEGVYFEERDYVKVAQRMGARFGRGKERASDPGGYAYNTVQLDLLPVRVKCPRCPFKSWVTPDLFAGP